MAYIIVLNPLIIGTQTDGAGKFLGGGDAPNIPLVALATAVVAGRDDVAHGRRRRATRWRWPPGSASTRS